MDRLANGTEEKAVVLTRYVNLYQQLGTKDPAIKDNNFFCSFLIGRIFV